MISESTIGAPAPTSVSTNVAVVAVRRMPRSGRSGSRCRHAMSAMRRPRAWSRRCTRPGTRRRRCGAARARCLRRTPRRARRAARPTTNASPRRRRASSCVDVDIADEPGNRAQHDVQAGEHRLAHERLVLLAGRAERLMQDVGDLEPQRGRVAVARHVDEARHEAAVRIVAHEDPDPAALLEVQDPHRGRRRARRPTPGTARRADSSRAPPSRSRALWLRGAKPARGDDRVDLLAQHRDVARVRVVRLRRVETDEALLSADLALRVELLHADVVEIRRAVHGRSGVALREHEQRLRRGAAAQLGRERGRRRRRRRRRVVAQDPEPASGHRGQHVGALRLAQRVLAVAGEHEVVVGHPAQERDGRCRARRGVDRRRVVARASSTDVADLVEHRRPSRSVAAATSPSTRTRSSCRVASSPASVVRSTSTCRNDSVIDRPAPSPVPAVVGEPRAGCRRRRAARRRPGARRAAPRGRAARARP